MVKATSEVFFLKLKAPQKREIVLLPPLILLALYAFLSFLVGPSFNLGSA